MCQRRGETGNRGRRWGATREHGNKVPSTLRATVGSRLGIQKVLVVEKRVVHFHGAVRFVPAGVDDDLVRVDIVLTPVTPIVGRTSRQCPAREIVSTGEAAVFPVKGGIDIDDLPSTTSQLNRGGRPSSRALDTILLPVDHRRRSQHPHEQQGTHYQRGQEKKKKRQ